MPEVQGYLSRPKMAERCRIGLQMSQPPTACRLRHTPDSSWFILRERRLAVINVIAEFSGSLRPYKGGAPPIMPRHLYSVIVISSVSILPVTAWRRYAHFRPPFFAVSFSVMSPAPDSYSRGSALSPVLFVHKRTRRSSFRDTLRLFPSAHITYSAVAVSCYNGW